MVAVNDSTLYQGGEKRYVLGSREKLDQPRARGTQPDCRFTNSKPATLNRGLGSGRSSQLRTSPLSAYRVLRSWPGKRLRPCSLRVYVSCRNRDDRTQLCARKEHAPRAPASRATRSQLDRHRNIQRICDAVLSAFGLSQEVRHDPERISAQALTPIGATVKSRSSYFRSSSFDERSRACEFIHYAKLLARNRRGRRRKQHKYDKSSTFLEYRRLVLPLGSS
jgi:hypothetical protein